MLFVALSSLQGRPMARAFDELAALGIGGIQLTPGNIPTAGFVDHVARSGIATRRHHGFAFDARKQTTWDPAGACVVDSESVHPPEDSEVHGDWRAWYERAESPPILEVMYPGYALGHGGAVERAMLDGIRLAVDVSHVLIQRAQGAMDDRVWRLLAAYDRIAEIHVSANAGRNDTHDPLDADAFGLAWARERMREIPIVLECYMHRLSFDERRCQIDLVRGQS
jgi:sugar phosphate isomerase/epimerase